MNSKTKRKSSLLSAAAAVAMAAAAAITSGCATAPSASADAGAGPGVQIRTDSVERSHALYALAWDVRCDGAFDRRAECAPDKWRQRLADLADADPAAVNDLRPSARRIAESWGPPKNNNHQTE